MGMATRGGRRYQPAAAEVIEKSSPVALRKDLLLAVIDRDLHAAGNLPLAQARFFSRHRLYSQTGPWLVPADDVYACQACPTSLHGAEDLSTAEGVWGVELNAGATTLVTQSQRSTAL